MICLYVHLQYNKKIHISIYLFCYTFYCKNIKTQNAAFAALVFIYQLGERGLYVKTEVHNVAILYNVSFAFNA